MSKKDGINVIKKQKDSDLTYSVAMAQELFVATNNEAKMHYLEKHYRIE